MRHLELIHNLMSKVNAGASIPAVDAEELQQFWNTGWRAATEQAARDTELDLTEYAPESKIAPLFLRCRILQKLVDDNVTLDASVFDAAAKAPFGKDLNYEQFVAQLKTR